MITKSTVFAAAQHFPHDSITYKEDESYTEEKFTELFGLIAARIVQRASQERGPTLC